jgi:hypothetical protein
MLELKHRAGLWLLLVASPRGRIAEPASLSTTASTYPGQIYNLHTPALHENASPSSTERSDLTLFSTSRRYMSSLSPGQCFKHDEAVDDV